MIGDVCPHYQGGIFTASRQWAADNPALIEGYIKAYLKGLDWCLDPENYEAAKALLLRRMPAIKPEAADNVMRNVLSEKTGLTPQAEIDYEGFRTVLDLRNRSDLTDYFLICSGNSPLQVQAIADAIVEKMQGTDFQVVSVEGYASGQWVILDLVDMIVHIFKKDVRSHYDLERLWGDVPVVAEVNG